MRWLLAVVGVALLVVLGIPLLAEGYQGHRAGFVFGIALTVGGVSALVAAAAGRGSRWWTPAAAVTLVILVLLALVVLWLVALVANPQD